MDFLTNITENSYLLYSLIFLGSFGDSFIFTNFIIQGELFFLPAGFLVATGKLNFFLVYFSAILGAIIGDNISYFLGKKYGVNIFKKENRFLNTKNLEKGHKYFLKYGFIIIILARLLGPVSWIFPTLAGIFGLNYKKFFIYNLIGICLGILQFIIYGFLIGLGIINLGFNFQIGIILILIIIFIIFLFFTNKKKGFFKKIFKK